MYPVTMCEKSMAFNRIKTRGMFLVSLLLVSLLLVAMLLCGHASAVEPSAPDDTVLYKSYPYGNFAADALREAGETDVAVIDNGAVYILSQGGDVALARATLSEREFLNILEQGLGGIVTDSKTERIISPPEELSGFLQISGFVLLYDASAPAGERVYSIESKDGEPWADWPITVTGPADLFGEETTQGESLRINGQEAITACRSRPESEDSSAARIRVLGTMDNTIVSSFPRWLVIAAPLVAVVLVCQVLMRNQKWKDAHGVFLNRRGRE